MTERVLGPTRSRRRRFLFVPLVLGVCTALFYIAGAQALPTGTSPQDNGLFQLDGNTLPTTCASPFPGLNAGDGDDWAALYTEQVINGNDPPCGSDSFSFVADGSGSADHTYWSQGGSKDAYDPGLGPWLWKPNDVSPDKNDLVNAFAAIYTAPNDDKFIYFGSDRFNTNGDAQQGFQFLQANTCLAGSFGNPPADAGGTAACPDTTPSAPTGCTPAFSGTNAGHFVDPFTGCPVHHIDGDLLILVNFNNGGTLGQAGVYEWFGADGAGAGCYGNGTVCDQPALFGGGADCVGVTPPNDFCSIANKTNLTTEPVWPYTAKGGGTTYKASAFIEGGLNLNRITGAGACFPSFIAESRSSAGPGSGLSLQAQLKDLAFGKFELCAPDTTLTASASTTTVHSGGSVTLTFSEDNSGNETLINPQVVTDNATCGTLDATDTHTGDTDNDGKLDEDETWVWTCTLTNVTSNVTVNAYGEGTGEQSGILVTGNPDCTPSGTTFCSATEADSVSITVISPSTQLTKTASAVVTYTYAELNDGTAGLSAPTVTDPNCGTVSPTLKADGVHNTGDTDNDGNFDPGETWLFTCTHTVNGPATDTGNTSFTNTATADSTDALGFHITACTDPSIPPANTICKNERDAVNVTITNSARSGG
jgi:hypothetical protein